MKRMLLAFAVLTHTSLGFLSAQNFYNVTFNSGVFPPGWSANDGRVMLVNNTASTGYYSSPTSPEASGGYNLLCQHCQPSGSTVNFSVTGVISTVNRTGIRVGFGRRATNAWNRPVVFEWSSNGSTWNLISSDVSDGASTTWGSTYYDLPSNADNVANLRFRFSYTTSTSDNCITAVPNFRIDDFTVGDNFSLPVELVHFEARPASFQTHLSWSTASETTNAYFAVERSTDGRNFREIGRVQGAGTTRETQHYTFLDEYPAVGTNYYRLRQVDSDGDAAYSLVRAVTFRANTLVRVFPSPVHDVLNLEWGASNEEVREGKWEVWDMAGRLLAKGDNASSSTSVIPVHDLYPGAYMLRIATDRQSTVQTFVKH